MLEKASLFLAAVSSLALVIIVAWRHAVYLKRGMNAHGLFILYIGSACLSLLAIGSLFVMDLHWLRPWIRPMDVFGAAFVIVLVYGMYYRRILCLDQTVKHPRDKAQEEWGDENHLNQ